MKTYSRPEMCANKARYRSATAAKRSKRKGKEKLHPYICPICRHFHMGHVSGSSFAQSSVSRDDRKRWLETIRIKERSEGL